MKNNKNYKKIYRSPKATKIKLNDIVKVSAVESGNGGGTGEDGYSPVAPFRDR